MNRHIAVLDIGKTNVKLHLLDHELTAIRLESMPNTVLGHPPYPHFEVNRIWHWLTTTLRSFGEVSSIGAINVSAHGATAALIDAKTSPAQDGLVLPVLDYEFAGPEELRGEYELKRENFEVTQSPSLPSGLNLAAQLYWQSQRFPKEFGYATHILLYPQYWVWRMSGVLCTEVTSLGCHTDLWRPREADWSSLAKETKWSLLFPPLTSAWDACATVDSQFAESAGLEKSCLVFPGLHDSNANFARYLSGEKKKHFTVVSTGTWTIVMASGVPLDTLADDRDMLANVDVDGNPIACARSMGGREYDTICKMLGADTDTSVTAADIMQVLDQNTMALPDFSGGSGPFGKRKGEIINLFQGVNGAAIATVYAALMIDVKLDLLGAKGDIFIEGPFAQNVMLCSLVAQLRPNQQVWASGEKTGTVVGAARITQGRASHQTVNATRIQSQSFERLTNYKSDWHDRLNDM